MKKVLSFATDFSLVCVLLMAFILPIVVSFNLVPRIYQDSSTALTPVKNENSNVLGVDTTPALSGNVFDFLMEESSPKGVTLNKVEGETTTVNMVVNTNELESGTLFLGNLINSSSRGTFKVSLLRSAEVSDSLKAELKINNSVFKDDEVLLTLNTSQKAAISVNVSSTNKLNYSQVLKVVVERVSTN